MKKIRLLIVLLAIVSTSNAQKAQHEIKIPAPVCYASGKVERANIPPPREFLMKSGELKSDIIVEYSSNFPEEAKAAFDYAVGIWGSILESTVPIHVSANWSSTLGTNTLASCGPETYYENFKNAPLEDTYYAVAIAEKIAGEELNGLSRSDIDADFSSKINWYYGTDRNTPDDQYDFVSVVLHELTHGLGFTGFFFVQDDLGAYGFYEFGDVTSFDVRVEQNSGNNLVDTSFYENASTQMKKVLESNSLFFESPVALYNGDGKRPQLYAPASYDDGSSVYHLNDGTYPTGNENSLMTHAVGMAEAIHDPGPLTRGIMEDIGWTNLFLNFTHAKDREETGPIDFVASIESYYPIDTSSLMVIYSTDDFASTDTLQLQATDEETVFSASLTPAADITEIKYYVKAADQIGRKRTVPTKAPAAFLTVKIGPDNEAPTIVHTDIPYFLLKGDSLFVEAEVDDNLGIDTVYVNYSINGGLHKAFALRAVSDQEYKGAFTFDLNALQDGDVISYSITAKDASVAKNVTVYPNNGEVSFTVEEIYDPVTTYKNDFNETDRDFLLSDFDVYTADNFVDGALHSPHPYPSPDEDNMDYNFSTFLKYPIILQEEGTISYNEVVLVEPGETSSVYGDDDFWDYVIVEGSKDYGVSWYELTDGYDSGSNATWKAEYKANIVGQDSETEGTSEWYVSKEFSLLQKGNFEVGDTILIRFRLYSDPYAHGWGWAIDDLSIQKPTGVSVSDLSEYRVNVYPNPFVNSFVVEIDPGKMIKQFRIDVYDSFGRNVRTIERANTSALKETINLSDQSSGLYLINVSENGIPVLTKKMIKN